MANNETRTPFIIWTVKDNDYKLRLKTEGIIEIEEKLQDNLLSILTNGDIPKLTTMLYITKVAMQPYQHGKTLKEVQNIYDDYIDEGGDQISFYLNVFIPLFTTSGFFTRKQAAALTEALKGLLDEETEN